MAKIYVSSTFNDLQEYREQVRIALRSMGHEDMAMEYYTAGEQRPVDKCLADVAHSDIYVGIFAFRYGYVPEGQDKSVTEQEYHKAVELDKPCLIFILKDDAPWPSNRFEFPQITRVTAFRKELCDKHMVGMFLDKNDLAKQVTTAIYNWALEHGHIPATVATIPQFDLERYYEALRKRYGALALEGLTPPQKEEYLQIQLRSVFVEQSVRENPPPVELPKEVWEKLSRDKEIHSEDLPSGIAIDDVRSARETYYHKPSSRVLDVLTDSHYQYVILLGDPGSGKSTLARYVMLSLIDPAGNEKLRGTFDGHLPLLIELRSYVGLGAEGHCNTFLEFLEYLGKTEGWALTQPALHNHLKNDGRAVVIFDGLDEIFEPEQREQFTRQIVGFCNDYPKVRVIVTSRVIGYRRKILTDAGFTHFTLQDLDEKQVGSFVTLWYDLAMSDPEEAKERRDRILKSFENSTSIRQLAGNPMLLTIMAIIGKHQELPRERWKLYDHAASVLIQHWDVNKHLKDKSIEAEFIGEDDKKELLRRLAYRMQSGDGGLAGNYVQRDGLQAEFESYLVERYSQAPVRAKLIAQAMIQQFRERNFILSLYGANLYGFVHRAFLEYFCASAFVYKFEKTKELSIEQLKSDVYGQHWDNQNWQEVLRLICGMLDEKWVVEIVESLLNFEYEEINTGHGAFDKEDLKSFSFEVFGIHKLALSATCLDEVTNLNSMRGVILRFTEHKAWQARYDILIILCKTRSRYSETLSLVRNFAINDPSANVRRAAVPALAEHYHEEPNTLPLIHQCIAKDDDGSVQNAAVLALAQHFHEDPETLPLLRELTLKDNNASVRGVAISTLAKYYSEDPETLTLIREYTNDSDATVRSAAISAIGFCYYKDPGTLPLLHKFALKDNDANVLRATVSALAKYYGKDPAFLSLLRERAANDPNQELRNLVSRLIIELSTTSGKKKNEDWYHWVGL